MKHEVTSVVVVVDVVVVVVLVSVGGEDSAHGCGLLLSWSSGGDAAGEDRRGPQFAG